MTVIAGIAIISVTSYIIVLAIHFTAIMLMAIDTAKYIVIRRVCVAFGARTPGSTVGSAVNRKMIIIVIPEACWCPTRIGIMAKGTVGWETRTHVIRIGRILIIVDMTSRANRLNLVVGRAGMAIHTIQAIMT